MLICLSTAINRSFAFFKTMVWNELKGGDVSGGHILVLG
jgi:hypothetical protein